MADHLTLEYEFKNDPKDDFGWLIIKAEGKGFAGLSGFWVQWQDVVEWSVEIQQFPLPATGIDAEWGYRQDGQYHQVIHIGLYQCSDAGRIFARLRLRDYYDSNFKAEFGFETCYANLQNFSKEVGLMMAKASRQATLHAD